MGLDCSHDAFHGAYSAFDRFRRAVCEATGGKWPDTMATDGHGYWTFGEGRTNDGNPGLYAFLCHSDCDGEIGPELCGKLAVEMEAILPALDAKGLGGGHIERFGGYGGVARRFIAGCRAAHAANEPLEFG